MGQFKEVEIENFEKQHIPGLLGDLESTKQLLDLMVFFSRFQSDFASAGVRDHILKMFYFVEKGDWDSYRDLRNLVLSYMQSKDSSTELEHTG